LGSDNIEKVWEVYGNQKIEIIEGIDLCRS